MRQLSGDNTVNGLRAVSWRGGEILKHESWNITVYVSTHARTCKAPYAQRDNQTRLQSKAGPPRSKAGDDRGSFPEPESEPQPGPFYSKPILQAEQEVG